MKLRLDGGRPRQWQAALLRALAAKPGWTVSVDARPAAETLPGNADVLFQLETLLHRVAPTHAAAAPRADFAPFAAPAGAPDLIVDLCGDVSAAHCRVWRLRFAGVCGEAALLGSLLNGQWPLAALEENGRVLRAARPGSERGDVMLSAFNDVLGRVKALILGALAGADSCPPAEAPDVAPAPVTSLALGRVAARQVAWLVVRRLYRLCFHTPHWRTGWRKLAGRDLFDLRAHPPEGWTNLPDDARRFYADPFPVLHRGRLTLFVEDFPHATGKGLISAVEFGPDGPLGRPEPVLELGCHLSYPFVFERGGEMWMIPETSGAGTIELFRAESFPGGWVREAVLAEGLVAGDATLAEHGGKWWMLACVQDEGGAYSDALHLWSAPDFRGPWTPHAGNPVLIDMASARPAGRIVSRDGALLRPVQDCRAGYGAALGIARITQLDDAGFQQQVETWLGPGPAWPGRRLHTLNSAGGFEFIDGSSRARRF